MIKYFKELLKWLWQLPQNLLAFIIEGILCNAASRGIEIDGAQLIYSMALHSKMTLGKYIFLPLNATERTIKHELGHTKQSLLLGPLYLIVIGIPALLHSIVHTICWKCGIKWDYYKFYTESWANKLVGLK